MSSSLNGQWGRQKVIEVYNTLMGNRDHQLFPLNLPVPDSKSALTAPIAP